MYLFVFLKWLFFVWTVKTLITHKDGNAALSYFYLCSPSHNVLSHNSVFCQYDLSCWVGHKASIQLGRPSNQFLYRIAL